MIAHYARDFDTVELNNTFYQLPNESTFDAWRDNTPDDFLFAVKGSRFITHMIKLKDARRGLDNFLPRASNVERLEEFLSLLPREHRSTFELRNATWMTDEVYDVLRKYDAAFCIYELAGYQSPLELTTDWTYIRLHGPTHFKYQGSYSDAQLEEWGERIRGWSRKLKAIYVYFDNDDRAYAVENARTLKRMLGKLARVATGEGPSLAR